MKIPRLTSVKMAVYTQNALSSLPPWLKSFSSLDILVPFVCVRVCMSRFVYGIFKTYQSISISLWFRSDWIIVWVTLHSYRLLKKLLEFFLTAPQNSVCRYAAYETAFGLLRLSKSAKRLFPCEFKLVDSTLCGFKEN